MFGYTHIPAADTPSADPSIPGPKQELRAQGGQACTGGLYPKRVRKKNKKWVRGISTSPPANSIFPNDGIQAQKGYISALSLYKVLVTESELERSSQWGAGMAQPVKQLTFDFGSDHD